MPSIRARLVSYAISLMFSQTRNATEQQILESVRDTWSAENAPEVVPNAEEETFRGSKETWQVFHLKPKGEPAGTGKVVVFWHGGAFLKRSQDRHWVFAQKLADELKCDVVVPIYTLAPLATGASCIQTCLELLAHLERDARYRGKQFVLSGDSAGGWIALRVSLALMESNAGKTTFRDRQDRLDVEDLKIEKEVIDYKGILDVISDVLLLSPLVETSVDRSEDFEAAERDPMLSKNIVDNCARLWSYGPTHAYPSFDFNIPENRKALPIVSDAADLPSLDFSAFSPVNGLDIIREYEGFERIHLTTFIGTDDILYPQNMRMQARLEALGVKSDMHVYDGLFHVFPVVTWLPESKDALEKIRKLF